MQFETWERIQDAIACIRSGELDGLACGRHELFDGVYVNIAEYETQKESTYEAHRRYIDIHYLIRGTECIEVADVKTLRIEKEYDEEADCMTGSAEGRAYPLAQGQFLILFPEQAHMPGIESGGVSAVKKAVLKVPV